MVRHGQRGDQCPKLAAQYAGHPDPILTKIGHQQAIETGDYLVQRFKQIEETEGKAIDQVIVKSSPFIRTMATCARICTQIKIDEVDLDYHYCEWLSTYLYSKNPIPKLEVRKKNGPELDEEFDL